MLRRTDVEWNTTLRNEPGMEKCHTDTHIDDSSSEASSTQDEVRHVGGATRNSKGHVSHWSCWETHRRAVAGLVWKLDWKLTFSKHLLFF